MTHTPGPWIDSPNASDAIISTDPDVIQVEIGHGGPFDQEAQDYYGGFVICESVYPKNKPLIKAAPEMKEALEGLIEFINRIEERGVFQFVPDLLDERDDVRAAGRNALDKAEPA